MAERKKSSDIGLRKAALICNMPPDPPDCRARGFAAGVAAHGIGSARAFQVNELAGTFAGIVTGIRAWSSERASARSKAARVHLPRFVRASVRHY